MDGDPEDHDEGGTESVHWVPVTGSLAPAEAIALATALESAGLRVFILQPQSERALPSVSTLHGPDPAFANQQLAVPEEQVQQAQAVLARARQGVAEGHSSALAMAISPEEEGSPAAPGADELTEGPRSPAFERVRARRFAIGVVLFITGTVWFAIAHADEFIVIRVGGVVVLTAGLLTMYTALSMREHDDEPDGPSDRPPDES
jgi:hypothetical protein